MNFIHWTFVYKSSIGPRIIFQFFRVNLPQINRYQNASLKVNMATIHFVERKIACFWLSRKLPHNDAFQPLSKICFSLKRQRLKACNCNRWNQYKNVIISEVRLQRSNYCNHRRLIPQIFKKKNLKELFLAKKKKKQKKNEFNPLPPTKTNASPFSKKVRKKSCYVQWTKRVGKGLKTRAETKT